MKIETVFDVFERLQAYVPAAVLSSALQTDLFWNLEKQSLSANKIAILASTVLH